VSATALNETLADEERRSAPVTLSEVLAACRELEMAGIAITRRSVREKLGRGSMTTIHNGVTQYESRREPPAPDIDLTQEDRNVIADLGARALAIAEGRVERVLAEREAALQTQIAAANARADDAIVAAEAMVSEAQRHILEALDTSEAARSARDSAVAAAGEDRQRALRLEGQVEVLAADKAEAVARSAQVDADLTATRVELTAEKTLRQQRDAEIDHLKAELVRLRQESAALIKDNADAINQSKAALAAEQIRLAEVATRLVTATSTVERLEQELADRAAEFQKISVALGAAEASAVARDQALKLAQALMPAEEAKAQQIAAILSAVEGQALALRSLETSLMARGADVPTLEQP
jgi:hypothetical protein